MFGTSLHSHKRKTYKSAASDEYIPGIRKKTQVRRRSLLIISKSGENTGLQVTDRVILFNLRDNIRRGRRSVAIFFQSGYRQRSLIKDDNWVIMPILLTWWPKMNTHSSACGLNDFKGCSRSTSNGWHRNDGACGDRLRSRNWNLVHLIDNENRVIMPILQWAKLTLTVALVAWVAAWARTDGMGSAVPVIVRSFVSVKVRYESWRFLSLPSFFKMRFISFNVVCEREVDYLSALIDHFPIQAATNTQTSSHSKSDRFTPFSFVAFLYINPTCLQLQKVSFFPTLSLFFTDACIIPENSEAEAILHSIFFCNVEGRMYVWEKH